MKILQFKAQGMEIPRGFAPCYRDFRSYGLIVAPIGLHLVIRWARRLYLWFLYVGAPTSLHGIKLYNEAYMKGYVDGWNRLASRLEWGDIETGEK